jgi:formylglycine-generating enzyme required for sulfatase activity
MKQYVRCDQPTDTGLFADVGSLMPNTLGIFDSLGNAMEWVHELSAPKQEGDLSGMFVRGGAYLIHPPNIDHSTAKSRKVESTSAEIGDWVDGLRLARWRD